MSTKTSRELACLLWPPSPLLDTIQPDEVHLWSWAFDESDGPAERDLALLDEEEQRRTARFHFVHDRVRYSVCHASMRRILGSYLRRPPESLAFHQRSGGKPELANEASALHFNLSHSKSVAVLAVALEMEVGVDVEDIRPIEPGVAEKHFSGAELASMATLEDAGRSPAWLDAFYRCWTRKEAILKAEGIGLRIPLNAFDVSLLADEPAALLGARPEAKLTADWQLHHLDAAHGTMGALAVNDIPALILEHALVD